MRFVFRPCCEKPPKQRGRSYDLRLDALPCLWSQAELEQVRLLVVLVRLERRRRGAGTQTNHNHMKTNQEIIDTPIVKLMDDYGLPLRTVNTLEKWFDIIYIGQLRFVEIEELVGCKGIDIATVKMLASCLSRFLDDCNV